MELLVLVACLAFIGTTVSLIGLAILCGRVERLEDFRRSHRVTHQKEVA